jgi:microcystin-dependent protein
MSEPFIAEVRIFGGNFAPRGWAFCNGQLLPIAQNTALFSLIGTTYGGDGRTTTALPDLQGRVPMHPGQGPGLSTRRLGEKGGVRTVTLTQAQMPNHTHTMQGAPDPGELQVPTSSRSLARGLGVLPYQSQAAGNLVSLDTRALPAAGGNQPHTNEQPYLGLNFIIALQGLYPSRS